jgi:hypothetical protein
MKKLKLPFKTGQHYEAWEFDLEVSEEEKIKGFDSYFYLKEISFLNTTPKSVELLFSWDILEVVLFSLELKTLDEFHQFKAILDLNFGKSTKHLQAEIYELEKDLELWLVCIPDGYSFQIAYGNKEYLKMIYD